MFHLKTRFICLKWYSYVYRCVLCGIDDAKPHVLSSGIMTVLSGRPQMGVGVSQKVDKRRHGEGSKYARKTRASFMDDPSHCCNGLLRIVFSAVRWNRILSCAVCNCLSANRHVIDTRPLSMSALRWEKSYRNESPLTFWLKIKMAAIAESRRVGRRKWTNLFVRWSWRRLFLLPTWIRLETWRCVVRL